jgi:hypothetical protein
MYDERMPKQTVTARMTRMGKRRRPRKRWTDQVEEGLKIMEMKNWY